MQGIGMVNKWLDLIFQRVTAYNQRALAVRCKVLPNGDRCVRQCLTKAFASLLPPWVQLTRLTNGADY